MQVYFKAYGIRGIRRVLKQFDEAELSQYQRDILHHRLQIIEFWRTNGKNVSLTARQFHTSKSHVGRLLRAKEKEGLGGLIPISSGPKYKRGYQLSYEQRCEIERYADLFLDWGHKKLKIFLSSSESTIYRYLKRKDKLVRNRCPGFFKKPTPRNGWRIERKKLPNGSLNTISFVHTKPFTCVPPAVYYFTKFYTPRFDQGVDLRLWNRTMVLYLRKIQLNCCC